jgi:hypothetical protein
MNERGHRDKDPKTRAKAYTTVRLWLVETSSSGIAVLLRKHLLDSTAPESHL